MNGANLFLSLLLLAAQKNENSSLPEMPSLSLDNLAPEIRNQVAQAYAELQARPRDSNANGRLGMLLQAYDQMETACTFYLRTRSLAPEEFRWAYYLAVTRAALGMHGEAAAVMREALEIRPDYLPARLQLAESLLVSGEVEESLQLYTAILDQDPGCAEAHYGIGRAKAARKDFAAAAEHYRKACALFPEFGAAHYALALTYRRLRDGDKAREHFALYEKNRLGRPPLKDPLTEELSQVLKGAHHIVKKAVQLESAGQIEVSIAEHERAVELDPGNVQAHFNLSILYGKSGKAIEAEKHYRAAIAINPNLAEGHYNFGKLLVEQGRQKEAAEAFRKALEVNPNYAEAHNNYAFLLMTELRLEEAERHYRAAIRNRPKYRMAHFNLGRILVHQGRISEAIEHFLQTLNPEDESTPGYVYGLGAAYARAGDREKALHYIREARRKAAALGQMELVASIDNDLRLMEAKSPE
jgi:tetratricopeptide (TPR) repeat protein